MKTWCIGKELQKVYQDSTCHSQASRGPLQHNCWHMARGALSRPRIATWLAVSISITAIKHHLRNLGHRTYSTLPQETLTVGPTHLPSSSHYKPRQLGQWQRRRIPCASGPAGYDAPHPSSCLGKPKHAAPALCHVKATAALHLLQLLLLLLHLQLLPMLAAARCCPAPNPHPWAAV